MAKYKKVEEEAAQFEEKENWLSEIPTLLLDPMEFVKSASKETKWIGWVALGCILANKGFQKIKGWKEETDWTTITFTSETDTYDWLMRWISINPGAKNGRSFSLYPLEKVPVNLRYGSDGPVAASFMGRGAKYRAKEQQAKAELLAREVAMKSRVCLVPAQQMAFTWKDFIISIDMTVENHPTSNGVMVKLSETKEASLRINCRDMDTILDLMNEIREIGDIQSESEDSSPVVYAYADYSGWKCVRECPKNRSVILPDGEYDRLLLDVANFYAMRSWYTEVGIPWRRGYLLHGIPGSGKTSTVIALAQELKMNVGIINLVDLKDRDLQSAIDDMPYNCLLVIEDIDAAFTTDREASEENRTKLTFSGLLNVMDGLATPDGRIMFLTTNHQERLDPAMMRPGRIDKRIEFRTACGEQISALAKRFGATDTEARKYGEDWEQDGISMAVVQERLIELYKKEHFATAK